MMRKPLLTGLAGSLALLGVYFSLVTALSGWEFAFSQFLRYWYWIIALAAGFGIQIGLFSYLRSRHRTRVSGKAVAISGSASGVAMVSCCAHYLVNIVPLIGISGLSAFVGQYQIEIFGIGAFANVVGIGYLVLKLRQG